MLNTVNLTKLYVKYMVKSQKIFYGYIMLFIILFVVISYKIELQVRSTYEGVLEENTITIKSDDVMNYLGKTIYVYTDKNQKVSSFNIISSEYQDGTMFFKIVDYTTDSSVAGGSEPVFVELTTGKRMLFQAIFGESR